MISAAIGLIAYVGTACFIVIYLALKKPQLLFNPSDYDKDVQKYLFGDGLQVAVDATEDSKIALPHPPLTVDSES